MQNSSFILTGGAGNQLFGIYAGLYFQTMLGTQVNFTYRSSGNYLSSSSLLDALEYSPPLKVCQHVSKFPQLLSRTNRILRNQIKLYNQLLNQFSNNYISPVFSADSKIMELKSHKNIEGYFQTSYYFDKMIELGLAKPRIKNLSAWYQSYLLKIQKDLPIVMHVRRGDYLKHSNIFEVLKADYYVKAINAIPKNLKNNPIWIFSDDQNYAYELIKYLPIRDYVVIDQVNQKAIEVLFLMSAGVSNITANSTFSWWSAKFSSSSNYVVAPRTWFRDRATPKNLLPKNWILI